MTQTTAERAKAIRNDLRAAGFKARQVSVRVHRYSMGATIHVELRTGSIRLAEVEAIARPYEHFRADAFGDPLIGGATLVEVRYSTEAAQQRGARYLPALRRAIKALGSDSRPVLIGRTGAILYRDKTTRASIGPHSVLIPVEDGHEAVGSSAANFAEMLDHNEADARGAGPESQPTIFRR